MAQGRRKGIHMRLFEYMKPSVMNSLEPTRQRFIAKMIKREVEQVAEQTGLTEEQVYYYYMSKGLYGGDRDIDPLS